MAFVPCPCNYESSAAKMKPRNQAAMAKQKEAAMAKHAAAEEAKLAAEQHARESRRHLRNVIAAAGGVFNAIGYSQGNVIIRGYAELYAGKEGYPKLNHHLSMFGMHMGVAGFPGCNMTAHAVCRSLAELLGELAYIPAIQAHLMQANYFVSAACHPRIVRLSRALPLPSSPTSSPHSPRRTPLFSSRTDDCSD